MEFGLSAAYQDGRIICNKKTSSEVISPYFLRSWRRLAERERLFEREADLL